MRWVRERSVDIVRWMEVERRILVGEGVRGVWI
jgi:hypothetical protein